MPVPDMNPQRTYRDLLVTTLTVLDYYFLNLMSIGMALVTYEDAKAGVLPFKEGEEIPIIMEVFEASDILSVQTVAHAAHPIAEMITTLKSINNITFEEAETLFETEVEGDTFSSAPVEWKNQTMDGLKGQMYICFSEMMYIINTNTYWMKFGHEQPEEDEHDFYMPTPSTYEMLATDDTNFSRLLQLSKYLEDHRGLAYR